FSTLICQTDIWDLFRTDQDDLVFSNKKSKFLRTLKVNREYTHASLTGNFKTIDGSLWHPLENLDILVIVNWLAEQGDLAVHASGVILGGKGYAFIGESGAGKSTLAASLARDHQALVLGEDQVILRYQEGSFWMHGTPWHENPKMCSAQKAVLSGIFFLDRKAEFGVSALSIPEGIARTLQNAFVPYYRSELLPGILDWLVLLGSKVPFNVLNYHLEQDVYREYLKIL